jgi:hypothetical protein
MAQRPDGKAAKTQPTAFTRPAAERIARVVRIVEKGNRNEAPLRFGRAPDAAGGKVFRVCTFTGSWAKTNFKTVTFRNVTTTPNTVVAVNLFAAISAPPGTANCAIAKDGTAWYLIAAECDAGDEEE